MGFSIEQQPNEKAPVLLPKPSKPFQPRGFLLPPLPDSWFRDSGLRHPPASRAKGNNGGVFCSICSTKRRFPWAGGWCRCWQLRPGETRSLTAPCPAAGSLRPEPARGRQREQEVRQQAQQEGAEGQPDAGHPPGHVLRGLAPLLRHQRDTGKHLRGGGVGFSKAFRLESGWVRL